MAEVDRNLLYLNPRDRRRYCANPFSHHHHDTGVHPNALTSRRASSRDLVNALSSNSTDLLEYLADTCEYTPGQVQAVGHTLGLTETELATLQEAEDKGRISVDEARKRVRFAAVMTETCIDNRSTVSTLDILTASEATLREWFSDVYPNALDETWAKIDRIEKSDGSGDFSKNAGHALATSELRRRLWYWWQVCQRLGADAYTGYLKGADTGPLDEFEAEHAA